MRRVQEAFSQSERADHFARSARTYLHGPSLLKESGIKFMTCSLLGQSEACSLFLHNLYLK